jgi:putative membrane protein
MRESLLLFLRGIVMGAVDLVPGVSAGTIAFITGIYVELVNSIKSFNIEALRILKTQGLMAAWNHINGSFLLILICGIVLSLFSLAGVMKFFLTQYPLPLWSFFIGLIIASVIFMLRQYPLNNASNWGFFCLGLLIAYCISSAPAVMVEGTLLTMFFAGSIALCAMILPGISGSFILVLLGLYPVFIDALVNVQLDILGVFALGGVIGLVLFSRLLSWLLANYHTWVIATMCGFLVASLEVIWPWKQVTESIVSASGKSLTIATENLLPQNYSALLGQDPQTGTCAIAFLSGLCIVFVIEYISYRFREKIREGK